MHQAAQSLYEQARSALAEQRTEDADALLRRAAATCPPGDIALGLRIRISASWVVFEREGLTAALAAVRSVRSAAAAAGLTEVVASASVQQGILHARSGDLAQAWRCLARVDATALALPDRMRMLMNRGTIASELHHLDEAADDLQTAADLADQVGVAPLQFMARHNLGWVQFLRGDLPAALRQMHDADRWGAELDRSVARLDRARVLLEAGLVTEAEDLLVAARAGTPSTQQAAEIDLDLARCALLLGHRELARQRAAAAGKVFARRHEPAWARRAALVGLLARPTMADARRLWRRATDADDRTVAAQAAAAAFSVIGDRDFVGLVDLVPDARRLARSPTVSLRLAGLVALAHAENAQARPDRARRLLRRASSSLTRAQTGLASLDLRSAAALHAEAAAALDQNLAAARGPAALVEAMERWRAAVRPIPQLRPAADPRVAAAATTLRRLRADHPAGAPLSSAERREITAAERHLRAMTWGATTALPPATVTLTAPQLRRAAAESAVCVVVVIRRGDDLSAVLLDDRPARLFSLGSASRATDAVADVHADLTASARLGPAHPLSGPVRASLALRLQILSQQLVSPLGELTGGLVIVPTRALSGVPWPALPGLVGVPVTVAPTASSWASAGRELPHPRVAVLTGPELPCAALEARAVRRVWVQTSTAAPASLVDAFAHHDVLHVIAHGQHRGDNPLFSSLHLDEGVVVAHELEGVDLRASHVVLSACEVGLTTHRPGDQPLGLTSMLLSSGVASVIAPVAPVNDELAVRVMSDYHQGLSAGVPSADALAAAVGDDPRAGAFVCFGAPWRVGVGSQG